MIELSRLDLSIRITLLVCWKDFVPWARKLHSPLWSANCCRHRCWSVCWTCCTFHLSGWWLGREMTNRNKYESTSAIRESHSMSRIRPRLFKLRVMWLLLSSMNTRWRARQILLLATSNHSRNVSQSLETVNYWLLRCKWHTLPTRSRLNLFWMKTSIPAFFLRT